MNSMGAGVYRLAMINYTVEMLGHELRERAFEHEAMPHTASLLRAATSITRDSAVAEDLVQETLLRAWRFFHRFDQGTNCKAWLFRIMLNLSTRVREKRSAESISSVPLDETHADQASTGGDYLQQLVIRRAFEALPQDQRSVLHLAIVDGFTCKEIAELLSLPMGTVMSRLSRGRVSLRDQLAGQELVRGKGMC
jgi:RNA polymerase sigma-70 factor (ECF subfamily)